MSSSTGGRATRALQSKPAIVIDLGSVFVRCGFAGEALPTHIVPSKIGVEDVDGGKNGLQMGNRTREEWIDILTESFSHLYAESLQCRPRERRVLVCESMVSPRPLREAVAHVLFRYLQIPALHLSPGPAPALYCTGLDTGVVVDIGSREAHSLAVYRDLTLQNSYGAIPLGVGAVCRRAREMIDQEEEKAGEGSGGSQGRPLTRQEWDEIVARACMVSVGGVPTEEQVTPMEFLFHGHRKVVVSPSVRTCAADVFFEGDCEGRSLATLVLDTIRRCPNDCRRALSQNILVVGGGALLPGLCARLDQEIRALARGDATGGGVREYAWAKAIVGTNNTLGEGRDNAEVEGGLYITQVPFARDLVLWTGASIMANLDGLSDQMLTNEQYVARGGRLPDWLSVSPADWLFDRPGAAAAAMAATPSNV